METTPYCPECKQYFKGKQGLQGHIRLKHEVNKKTANIPYLEIDPDIEDAERRILENGLYEKNKMAVQKIYGFNHRNSLT